MYIRVCVLYSQKQRLGLGDLLRGFCFLLPAASCLIFLSHSLNSDRLFRELSLPLGPSVPTVGHSGHGHLSGLPVPVCSSGWIQTHRLARRPTCIWAPAYLSWASFPDRLIHSHMSLFYLFIGSSLGSFVQPLTHSLIHSVNCMPYLKIAPWMVCSRWPVCTPVLLFTPSPSSNSCLSPTSSGQLFFASISSKCSINNTRKIYSEQKWRRQQSHSPRLSLDSPTRCPRRLPFTFQI